MPEQHSLSELAAKFLGLATQDVPDPGAEYRVKPLSAYEREDPKFLWEPYFRLGQLGLVEARQGTGKTTFLASVAMQNERGQFPWSEPTFEPGPTLYIGGEDSPGEFRATYEDLGGDADFVLPMEPWAFDDAGMERFEAVLDANPARLIIIDPVLACFPRDGDQNGNEFLSRFLGRLRGIAMQRKVCIVVVRHFTKSIQGKHFSEYGGGGVQWQAIVRTQLVLLQLPSRPYRYVGIFPARGSLRAAKGEPFGFEFLRGEFSWVPPEHLPVEEFAEYYALDVEKREGLSGGQRGPSRVEQLEGFLREALGGGPRYEDELKVEAAALGLKPEGKPWRTARERVVGNNWRREGFERNRVVWWLGEGQVRSDEGGRNP